MALSRGLGDWQAENERKRRQEELRAQQLADLESQRSYAAGLLAENRSYNAGIRAEDYAREDQQNIREHGVPLPTELNLSPLGGPPTSMGSFAGMYPDRAYDLRNKMYPKVDGLDATQAIRVGTPDGGYLTINADATNPGKAVAPFESPNQTPEYRGVIGGVPTFDLVDPYRRPMAGGDGVRPPNPSESLRDMVLLDKLIKETGTRDIGTPTMELRQGQDKSYTDIPSSGGAGLITYRQLMSLDSPEAALNAYNGALADSSAGRGYMGISDLPNGALPIDMRQNAWRDVVAKQPTYSTMEALPNFFNVPPGWTFMANDPNTATDDTYKKVNVRARDEEMPVEQFIAQKAIPKTNDDGDIAWSAFRKMFKDQYGKDIADIMSGKAPPPAPGRVVGSAGASPEAAAKVDLLLGGGL